MKQSFRSLTLVLAGAVMGGGAESNVKVRGQEPVAASQEAAGAPLVTEAARRVAAEAAVAAEIRYRVDAFGHQLVGTGRYLQVGAGSEKLLRLELRMLVGDKPATIQEIRGEDFYWLRREVPPVPPTLGRVDLRQLRRSLISVEDPAAEALLPQGGWIVLGGLPRLMSALAENFDFDAPQAEELPFHSPDGKAIAHLPIWKLAGRWKPERLAALADLGPGKGRAIPEQLPTHVELVLSRADDVLPLFPFRITYWQAAPEKAGRGQEKAAEPRELVTLELFNVSRREIDRREFQYQPGEQEVQELTPAYVQRYREQPKLR